MNDLPVVTLPLILLPTCWQFASHSLFVAYQAQPRRRAWQQPMPVSRSSNKDPDLLLDPALLAVETFAV
jgi:hypothetical protein